MSGKIQVNEFAQVCKKYDINVDVLQDIAQVQLSDKVAKKFTTMEILIAQAAKDDKPFYQDVDKLMGKYNLSRKEVAQMIPKIKSQIDNSVETKIENILGLSGKKRKIESVVTPSLKKQKPSTISSFEQIFTQKVAELRAASEINKLKADSEINKMKEEIVKLSAKPTVNPSSQVSKPLTFNFFNNKPVLLNDTSQSINRPTQTSVKVERTIIDLTDEPAVKKDSSEEEIINSLMMFDNVSKRTTEYTKNGITYKKVEVTDDKGKSLYCVESVGPFKA